MIGFLPLQFINHTPYHNRETRFLTRTNSRYQLIIDENCIRVIYLAVHTSKQLHGYPWRRPRQWSWLDTARVPQIDCPWKWSMVDDLKVCCGILSIERMLPVIESSSKVGEKAPINVVKLCPSLLLMSCALSLADDISFELSISFC